MNRLIINNSNNRILNRRYLSTAKLATIGPANSVPPGKSTAVIAFDIDGVLIRGKQLIPGAIQALHRITPTININTNSTISIPSSVNKYSIPYIFMTNGGGVTESAKAAQLSNWFQLNITESQIVLAHSPMRELASKYSNNHILAVGGNPEQIKIVASKYGFKHILTPNELAERHPELVPIQNDQLHPSGIPALYKSHTTVDKAALQSIRSILVFHDVVDWYRDCQIILDILLANRRTANPTTLYFSNGDILFSGRHWAPRLAQGSFRIALEAIYHQITGLSLQYSVYGKPQLGTYQYAEQLLCSLAASAGYSNIHRFYMIGDNPSADILGSNMAGNHWHSILVESGTIKPSGQPEEQPKFTCTDVAAAIEYIAKQEQLIQNQ